MTFLYLYDLDESPETALAQIREHCGWTGTAHDEALREGLFQDVTELLSDEFVASHVPTNIARLFDHLKLSDSHAEVRGPLGLYLTLHACTAVSLAPAKTPRDLDGITSVFGDLPTRECFRSFYRISDHYDLSQATVHRVGTTSVIIKCHIDTEGRPAQPEHVALKCLLPRYLQVRAIRDTTARYRVKHEVDHDSVPRVYDSSDRTIAMRFLKGKTLAERLETRAVDDELREPLRSKHRALKPDDIEFIRQLGLELCRILGDLAEPELGHRHLDLSPSNIIVVSDDDQPLELALIDFGHNFTITERVGSSAAFRRAELYVAPELIDDPSIDDWRCDVYSLGVILLEAAAKQEIRKEDLTGELDRLWQGARPWDGAPGLARVIEELIDREPRHRLALVDDETLGENPYPYLEGLIAQETEVLALYEERTENGFGLLRWPDLLRLRQVQLLNLLGAARKREISSDDAYQDFSMLTFWASLAVACWAIAAASFTVLTMADLGLADLEPWVKKATAAVDAPFEVGDFWQNLPGRLVALTFAVTAVTYYVNNFSTLSPRRLETRIGWISEVVMRTVTFGLTIPIMVAIAYDPSSWPLCAGLGTLLVVLNNFLALRIAIRAHHWSGILSTRGDASERFIKDVFKEWWLLMGAYSLTLIAIGLLLYFDVAQDEAVFAVLVVLINITKMYRLNCVENAPLVRGSLSRDILTLRRIDRLSDANGDRGEHSSNGRGPRARLRDWLWAPVELARRS